MGAVTLGSYEAFSTDNASNISTTTTLAEALSILDERIYEEESAREIEFARFDQATPGTGTTTTFVSSISKQNNSFIYTTKDITAASTSAPGIVQLSNTVGNDETKALTPKGVTTATFAYTNYTVDDPTAPAITSTDEQKTIAELSAELAAVKEELLKLKHNLT